MCTSAELRGARAGMMFYGGVLMTGMCVAMWSRCLSGSLVDSSDLPNAMKLTGATVVFWLAFCRLVSD